MAATLTTIALQQTGIGTVVPRPSALHDPRATSPATATATAGWPF
ncbi:hypothetical protein [Devosia sp.]|nr:hypothetical protein [Devosia sp.]